MSDLRWGPVGTIGKTSIILVEIRGKMTRSVAESLLAEITYEARRVGLVARVLWPKRAGRKAKKK